MKATGPRGMMHAEIEQLVLNRLGTLDNDAMSVVDALWPLLAQVWKEGFTEGECYAGLFKPGDVEPPNPYLTGQEA